MDNYTINYFMKDFRKFMKQHGQKAMELYEKGRITLDEAYRIAHDAELEEIRKEWEVKNND